MYLITVEGGDGSGKGEAVRILSYLANKMAFPNVHVTHEPRRHSQLGKLALSAVSKENIHRLKKLDYLLRIELTTLTHGLDHV